MINVTLLHLMSLCVTFSLNVGQDGKFGEASFSPLPIDHGVGRYSNYVKRACRESVFGDFNSVALGGAS